MSISWGTNHCAAVVEVFQDLERLGNDRMAFRALDMGDKADAAGVMFVTRIIEALRRRKTHR